MAKIEPLDYCPPRTRQRNEQAMRSVLGALLFFIPPMPVLALIAGIKGLRATRNPDVGGRGWAIAGITLSGLGIAAWMATVPVGIAVHRAIQRVQCLSNLREIGQAVHLYANDHNGQFPASFADLWSSPYSLPQCFVCPASDETPAQGANPQALAADFARGGHCSYIYVGQGLNTRMMGAAASSRIIAYEWPGAHPNGPISVLFADGHGQSITRAEAIALIQQLHDSLAATTAPASTPQ